MAENNEKEPMDVDSNEKQDTNNNESIIQESDKNTKSVTSEPEATNHKQNNFENEDNKKVRINHKITDDDKKKALREKLRKVAANNRKIVTKGCGEWRCTNPFCASNMKNELKTYSESEASKLALKMIKLKHKKCELFPQIDAKPLKYERIKLLNNNNDNEEEKETTKKEIYDEILFAFKNWHILSESFLDCEKKVSETEISIDFVEMRDSFDIIVSRDDLRKDINDILFSKMSAFLDEKRRIKSLYELRALIILLLYPQVLSEDIECHSLLSLLLSIIEALSASDFSKIIIIRSWFSQLAQNRLSQILAAFQQYMTLKITICEDEVEDMRDEWRHELKYDSVSDADEREEIEQEVSRKCEFAREKYIIEFISGVIKMIDIIYVANENNKLDDFAFKNDGLNSAICGVSGGSIYRRDFLHYRERDFFTFLSYPYLLSAASKSKYLEFENLVSQHRARRRRMFDIMLSSTMSINRSALIEELDLVLRIRRSPQHIIGDTLGMLQIASAPDLRKRLRIIFDGEEGIDQGGLTKEYFQLIMKELFDPKYGMFIYSSTSCNFWFNRDSFDLCHCAHDEEEQLNNYELVGKLIGVAIYNNTILDLRFPSVIFKKILLNSAAAKSKNINYTLNDLKQYDIEMFVAFKKMQSLMSEGHDLEDIYCRNFVVTYRNMFGVEKEYDLCGANGGGAKQQLKNENCEQYIQLYINYILNDSISRQFDAFLRGFNTVVVLNGDCSLFNTLAFKAQELELLICGSQKFDFDELESSTKYQDGLHKNCRLVRDFWNIVHQLTDENKRKLLTFCTGSDRVPINGLGELALTISKNGNDNNKLPTSHTCFNHLLLPEYSNKDILKTRLLTAIQNSHGFGLL